MANQVNRIDATRRHRAMAAYIRIGDGGGLGFYVLAVSFIAMIVLIFAAFGTGNLSLLGLGIFIFSSTMLFTSRAVVAGEKIELPAVCSYSRDATNIYNRLNDTYKIAAKPMVLKIYDIESHAHTYNNGLGYKDPEAVAIRERINALNALEAKQKSEIARPIIDDRTDMIGAELTLNADYIEGIKS